MMDGVLRTKYLLTNYVDRKKNKVAQNSLCNELAKKITNKIKLMWEPEQANIYWTEKVFVADHTKFWGNVSGY